MIVAKKKCGVLRESQSSYVTVNSGYTTGCSDDTLVIEIDMHVVIYAWA